ncbi:NB-ARC domain-containing protein [Actinokineospora sp. G85]|uniref:NB-ARC domain-containing protein n=1 Tax=Actinokineospora sp. G85 TaxID=3406626 RepID=UPI003C78CBB5
MAALAPAGNRPSIVVSAVAGMGGIGKTALARQAAASAASHFPGGVFWVNLHGYSGDGAVPASAVYSPLLRHLIPDDQIPKKPSDQATVYDQVLAWLSDQNRPLLLVLDNAATTDQVRSLLPPRGTAHRALITTRDTLNLPNSTLLTLDALTLDAAVTTLDQSLRLKQADDTRITSDPTGATALAQACAGLPLALRIAAALLAAETDLTPAKLATQLTQAPGVAAYTHGDQALAAVFNRSWNRLRARNPDQARLLRLLCLNPGPDLSTETAAALTGQPEPHVLVDLRGLRQAHLLHNSAADRWAMHDLVRAHIATLDAPEQTAEHIKAAHARLLDHYLTTADQADSYLRTSSSTPSPNCFANRKAALAWLESEHTNLAAIAADTAAAIEDHRSTFQLAICLYSYLDWRRNDTDWPTSATRLDQADANNPGLAPQNSQQFNDAASAYEHALTIYQRLGGHQDKHALTIHQRLDDHQNKSASWADLGRALEKLREFRDRHSEAKAWHNLGAVLQELGLFGVARRAWEQAHAVYIEIHDSEAAAIVAAMIEELPPPPA